MILSGLEINNAVCTNDIVIEPYTIKQLNPNSYNLKLHNELLVYDEEYLDMKKDNKYRKIIIPEDGLILEPNKLYLGRTVERTYTNKYVPMLEGRSSIGRLGLFIHITAGFGDVGFDGCWTLEISCIEPVKIYPNVEICQIYYHTLKGSFVPYSADGKYNCNNETQTSRLYREFGSDMETPTYLHNIQEYNRRIYENK